MTDAVLDSSALLALLWDEPGTEVVERLLSNGPCAMSAVNVAEVAGKLSERGATTEELAALMTALQLEGTRSANRKPYRSERWRRRRGAQAFPSVTGQAWTWRAASESRRTRPMLRGTPWLGIEVTNIRAQ